MATREQQKVVIEMTTPAHDSKKLIWLRSHVPYPAQPIHVMLGVASLALSVTAIPAECITGHGDTIPSIVIEGEACSRCKVEARNILTLGSSEGPGALDGLKVWARRSASGNTYVVAQHEPSISVFDASGAFITSIGSRGEGPGEYRYITGIDIDSSKDRLYIFDGRTARLTTLTETGDSVLDTTPLEVPPGPSPIILPDGQIVVNALIQTPNLVGYPLHLLEASGQRLRSFGSVDGAFFPTEPYPGRRILAVAGDNQIWAARPAEYRLERWTIGGTMTMVVERNVDWFHGSGVTRTGDPPPPLLIHVLQDREGLLWLFTAVADANWESALVRRSGGSHPMARVEDYNGFRDTIVEVIDIAHERVVASGRFDGYVRDVLGDGLIGLTSVAPDLTPRYEVWEVGFTTNQRRD